MFGRQRKADEMEEECDPEIFDDTDFYQLLLKELLERNSTTNETDEFGSCALDSLLMCNVMRCCEIYVLM